MPWRLLYTERAQRDIHQLEPAMKRRLARAMIRLSDDPAHGTRKLTDPALGGYRLRVGDWRVIFDIEGNDIIVLRVGHRREIYRR